MTAIALTPHPLPAPGTLRRSLLLALLLHVWLVLLLGNVSGGAAPGEGVWGRLTVRLLSTEDESGAPAPGEAYSPGVRQVTSAPASPRPEVIEPKSMERPSPGKAVLATSPTTSVEQAGPVRQVQPGPPEQRRGDDPGAPDHPLDAEPSQSAPASRDEPTIRAPVQAPTETATPAVAPAAPVTQVLPDGFRPVEPIQPPPATLRQPAPAAPQLPDNRLPAAIRRLEDTPLARPLPAAPEASLRPSTPQPDLPAEWAAPLPAPAKRLETVPDAGLRRTAPAALALRPPASNPDVLPQARLPATVQRLDAPPSAPVTALRPTDLAPPPQPPSTAALDRELPAAVQRLEAPVPSAITSTTTSPSRSTVEPLRLRATVPASDTEIVDLSRALPGGVDTADRLAMPAPSSPAPSSSASAPGALAAVPTTAAASSAASAAVPQARAPLNLNLPRGDLAARRGPGVLELLPQPPERKSKLEKELENATKVDCRKAYADKGLLAAVPLVIDAARGKGCQW